MPRRSKPKSSENGKLLLADALFDRYHHIIFCINCTQSAEGPEGTPSVLRRANYTKDSAGRPSPKDGLRHRYYSCLRGLSNCRKINVTVFIDEVSRQLRRRSGDKRFDLVLNEVLDKRLDQTSQEFMNLVNLYADQSKSLITQHRRGTEASVLAQDLSSSIPLVQTPRGTFEVELLPTPDTQSTRRGRMLPWRPEPLRARTKSSSSATCSSERQETPVPQDVKPCAASCLDKKRKAETESTPAFSTPKRPRFVERRASEELIWTQEELEDDLDIVEIGKDYIQDLMKLTVVYQETLNTCYHVLHSLTKRINRDINLTPKKTRLRRDRQRAALSSASNLTKNPGANPFDNWSPRVLQPHQGKPI